MNVNEFRDRKCTVLSDEEMNNINDTYTFIKIGGSCIDENSDYYNDDKYNWEMVVRAKSDYKYGRSMISRKYKLIRCTTMGEFYGSGEVD